LSILSIDDYKLIDEEAFEYSDICKRAHTLLLDLGSEDALARRFIAQLEDALGDDTTSVSFITSYKNYIIPKNFAGVALIKWVTPEEYTDYLAPSDFCIPLFVAQKALPVFADAAQVMEEFIRVEAEARQYAYELRESLKL
jgi:hypothetical protein